MATMHELRHLDTLKLLNPVQSEWLKPNKPAEELYDLLLDPYELNNLVEDVNLKDTLALYRRILYEWVISSKDLGVVPEQDLLQIWLDRGQLQKKLYPLQLKLSGDNVQLLSDRTDATIVWKIPFDTIWTIYTEPLSQSLTFEAKAERIGFDDSDVLFNN